jgi:hypothetical protein
LSLVGTTAFAPPSSSGGQRKTVWPTFSACRAPAHLVPADASIASSCRVLVVSLGVGLGDVADDVPDGDDSFLVALSHCDGAKQVKKRIAWSIITDYRGIHPDHLSGQSMIDRGILLSNQ